MKISPLHLESDKVKELEDFIATLHVPKGNTMASRAVLIPVLHHAQEIFGYLPREVQKIIAIKLDLHVSEIYGVVSFYHYFKMQISGKYMIDFCLGTACFVRGAPKLIEKAEELLGIKMGETTADRKFTLGSLRCVGACSLAPVLQINGKTFGRVTPAQIKQILADCP